jgi:hypothetical protein
MNVLRYVPLIALATGLTACVDINTIHSPMPRGDAARPGFPPTDRDYDPMAHIVPAKKVIPPGQTSGVYKGQAYVCATSSCKKAIPVRYPPPPGEKKN